MNRSRLEDLELGTAVLVQLYKAWRVGLGIPAGRLVTVFRLNGFLTYRFLRELESEGLLKRVVVAGGGSGTL